MDHSMSLRYSFTQDKLYKRIQYLDLLSLIRDVNIFRATIYVGIFRDTRKVVQN